MYLSTFRDPTSFDRIFENRPVMCTREVLNRGSQDWIPILHECETRRDTSRHPFVQGRAPFVIWMSESESELGTVI